MCRSFPKNISPNRGVFGKEIYDIFMGEGHLNLGMERSLLDKGYDLSKYFCSGLLMICFK